MKPEFRLFIARAALLMLSLTAVACNNSTTPTGLSDGGTFFNPSPPTISSTLPANSATEVALNGSVSAIFSMPMDPATLTTSTFTLTSGTSATHLAGTVIYANAQVTFWPSVHLAASTTYTATLTTGTKSASEVALGTSYVWTFASGTTTTAGAPLNLGTAANYAILAKTGISTVPTSRVTGDLGISPAAASYITGFSLTADATNTFATSPQVTGRVYAADYASPTPSNLTTAIGDMQVAFTDAAGRAPDVTELGAGDISGMTLTAGVYRWSTGLLLSTDATLSGSATDVWIFQVAQDVTVNSGATIHLAGGALAKNIFWQVSGSVDLGTTAHLEGNVLAQTAENLRTSASINGRLLAQTAVNIEGSTVVEPAR
jgi:Ice-binding-like/Bacterial Ig-like domain